MMKSGNLPAFLTKLKTNIIGNTSKLKLINPKYRNVIITVLVFSMMLSGVFVFSVSGDYTNEEASDEVVSTESPEVGTTAIATIEADLVTAYGLYIDGSFIAASVSEDELNTALDVLLTGKVSSLSVTNVSNAQFMNEIKIESGSFQPEYVVDSTTLQSLLGIMDEYSFTFQLSSVSGEEVSTELSVLVQTSFTEEVEIAYDTSYVDTDLKTAGYEKVVNSGAVGVGVASYELVYIDGELVQSNFISTDVVTEPVDEVIERGVLTKDKSVNSIGVFEYPYDGQISSYYGWRDIGYHYGIDLVAYEGDCYGDDVHAAGDGVITFAGTKSGFGTVLYIDHGNGLVTVYGHLSAMNVKVGDIVKTGDVIGQIGATGRVTGPHLHFEVQKDGNRVDPLLYLKKR